MTKNIRPYLLPIWISGSVIFGPFVAISQFSLTRGGGDFCDSIYFLPNGGYDPARLEEFARANQYADSLSILAITIGIIILVDYWIKRRDNVPLELRITLTALALFMMLGYALIIFVFSGAGRQAC